MAFPLSRPQTILCFNLQEMDVAIRVPDAVARRLSAAGGDISRRTLEVLALEGYRDQTLTLDEVSEMGLSRVQTEDFLGQHHVPLSANRGGGSGP